MQEVGLGRGAVAAYGGLSQLAGAGAATGPAESNTPMDLSSGGLAALTTLFRSGGCGLMQATMPVQPLTTAQRLAELVRLQHRRSEEREDKRKWGELELEQDELEVGRGKVRRHSDSPSPDTVGLGSSPPPPGSPGTGSSSGSESGREEKRRRLDLLLNMKFQDGGGPELQHRQLDTVVASSPPCSPGGRRASVGSGRRKQAHPSSPSSPPALSLRPPSDLFPPPSAVSSPRDTVRSCSPLQASDYSAQRPEVGDFSAQRPASPEAKEQGEQEAVKMQQLLQMQLLSGLGQGGPGIQNPLLYYSYYAQMMAAMQAQQKMLDNSPQINNNNLPVSVKDLLSSPLRLGALAGLKQEPDLSRPLHAYSPLSLGRSPSLQPSPLKQGDSGDEPRKRAPRALTGRYVRTGTAASPQVLQILRKKIEGRIKLKELLGESHVYFGQINQKPTYKSSPAKNKKMKV